MSGYEPNNFGCKCRLLLILPKRVYMDIQRKLYFDVKEIVCHQGEQFNDRRQIVDRERYEWCPKVEGMIRSMLAKDSHPRGYVFSLCNEKIRAIVVPNYDCSDFLITE